jgi:uncharacterized protein (TIGR02145 family)
LTITFREDINTVATGKNKVTALKLTVIAKYTDNTSASKQIALDVFVQDCSCGCTVKSNLPAGWLTFLCYNLGVPESTKQMTIDEQMTTSSPTGANVTNNTIYGDLYQWGRKADGHEKRTSARYPSNDDTSDNGPISQLDSNGQVANPSAIGKFVKAKDSPNDWRSSRNNNLWYNNGKTVNDPCPPGWRVPTPAEWGSIFKNGTATVNKWTWTNVGTAGYKISPDNGNTYTLFLPAAGFRYRNNGVIDALTGARGYYWSSTTSINDANYLFFSSSSVEPNSYSQRANGFSVRCVAE